MQQIYRRTPMPKCEIVPRHECSPVHFLHIFRTHFPKKTCGRLLLNYIRMYIYLSIMRIGWIQVCKLLRGGIVVTFLYFHEGVIAKELEKGLHNWIFFESNLKSQRVTLREKCPYSGLFQSVFSHIWTRIKSGYGKTRTKITPNTNTFYAVLVCQFMLLVYFSSKN